MLKKLSIGIMTMLLATTLFACAGASQNNQVDPQVAELQKQIADLQQQVNQQGSQNQVAGTVQPSQSAQPIQQTQPVQQTQPIQNAQQPIQTQSNQGGYVPPANVGQQVGGNFGGNMQGNTQGISVEDAKAIATQHAGFAIGNVTFVKQSYDFDDGIAKWEIDFVVNTSKYEYEVNATNGAIVKYQVESIYDD